MRQVHLHIWPATIYFLRTKADLKQAKKLFSSDFYQALVSSDGQAVTVSQSLTVAIYLKTNSSAVLAHECLHAIHHIFSKLGLFLTRDTEEVYAYTLEYLMREARKK